MNHNDRVQHITCILGKHIQLHSFSVIVVLKLCKINISVICGTCYYLTVPSLEKSTVYLICAYYAHTCHRN